MIVRATRNARAVATGPLDRGRGRALRVSPCRRIRFVGPRLTGAPPCPQCLDNTRTIAISPCEANTIRHPAPTGFCCRVMHSVRSAYRRAVSFFSMVGLSRSRSSGNGVHCDVAPPENPLVGSSRPRRSLNRLLRAARRTSRARAGAASARRSRTPTWSAATHGRAATARRRAAHQWPPTVCRTCGGTRAATAAPAGALGLGQLRELRLQLRDGPAHQPVRTVHRIAPRAAAYASDRFTIFGPMRPSTRQ